jgi:hypothetical protein
MDVKQDVDMRTGFASGGFSKHGDEHLDFIQGDMLFIDSDVLCQDGGLNGGNHRVLVIIWGDCVTL